MRILVLAGETAELGPRSTSSGLYRALRDSEPLIELATSLPEVSAEADPEPPVRGLRAALAAARRSDLVLLTQDAFTGRAAGYAALMQSLHWTRAFTAGIALVERPPESRLQGWLERRALSRLKICTAADEHAARTRRASGASDVSVLPDPALLVPAAYAEVARAALTAAGAPVDGTPLIGITPRAVHLHDQPDAVSDERLVTLLARVLDLAVQQHEAFVVCLPARSADVALCDALAAAVQSHRICVAPVLDPETFKGVASEMSMLICAHRRAALLATSVGRPTIGLGMSGPLSAALERAGPGHTFLDASLFLRAGLAGQLGELVDTALEKRRTPVVRFEELRAHTRAGIRRLLAHVD